MFTRLSSEYLLLTYIGLYLSKSTGIGVKTYKNIGHWSASQDGKSQRQQMDVRMNWMTVMHFFIVCKKGFWESIVNIAA